MTSLDEFMEPHVALAEFWQQGQFKQFDGKDGVVIQYAQFTSPQHQYSLVISPGRVEGYLKYQELIFDCFQQGYNVYVLDHRGQGLSDRMQRNLEKGYVKYFDDYAADLRYFIEEIIGQQDSNPLYLLAHSMGGAIAIRAMQLYQLSLKAAVLSSPMIAINTGSLPHWLASLIVSLLNGINRTFSMQSWYFMAQGNYCADEFAQNRLTHDEQRYQRFVELYQQYPKLKLGGVTVNWLAQAFVANHLIFADIKRITTPIRVLQAGADTIVDNQAQFKFCQKLHSINAQLAEPEPIVIEGAYHELFIEQDKYRTPALNAAFSWFVDHR